MLGGLDSLTVRLSNHQPTVYINNPPFRFPPSPEEDIRRETSALKTANAELAQKTTDLANKDAAKGLRARGNDLGEGIRGRAEPPFRSSEIQKTFSASFS